MIPQKIHYCWLSAAAKPQSVKEIMKSWSELLPAYELVYWDAEKYKQIPDKPKYVEDAYRQGKWAFVCDYVRAWALWNEGGWYFDCDFQVLRSNLVDVGKNYRFVSAVEVDGQPLFGEDRTPRVQIQAAFLGAEKNHPFVKDLIEYYKQADFKFDSGNTVIAPNIYAKIAEKYGFEYRPAEQTISEGMYFFPPEKVLAHIKYLENPGVPLAIHHCLHSWCPMYWGVELSDVILMKQITAG